MDRFTTKDSYIWNITHNTESTAVRNLKPERWGSPLVQEKYQEEKTCDKRHPSRIIIIIIIIIIMTVVSCMLRAYVEKLVVIKLVKKYSVFSRIRTFIPIFRSAPPPPDHSC